MKKRIKIHDDIDLKDSLKRDGYNLDNEDIFIKLKEIFNVEDSVISYIKNSFNEEKITYVVDDTEDFINYIKELMQIKSYNDTLYRKIKHIKNLTIYRTEYDRIPSNQEDIKEILEKIKYIQSNFTKKVSDKELSCIDEVEDYINKTYLYAKDIELFKKMIIENSESVECFYNIEEEKSIIKISLPKEFNLNYIKAKEGSVEYHKHIKNNIQRLKRLIKNIDKYILKDAEGFYINHSSTFQDSINIAVATFNGEKFKAISGKIDIEGFSKIVAEENQRFIASKVNKLGRLGTGYRRTNDSEKKILEEIHAKIKNGVLEDKGELILYSRWEPCPSCYYVIYQFNKIYPKINIQIRFTKAYG